MPAPNLAPMQQVLAQALSLSKQNTAFQFLQGYSWVLDKLTRQLGLILSDPALDAALLANALHETLSDEERAFLLALPDVNKHAVVGGGTFLFDNWKSEIFDFFFNPEKTELRLEGSVTPSFGLYADRLARAPAFATVLKKASKKLVSLELIGNLDSFGITDNGQAALLNDADILQPAFLGLSQLRSLILSQTDASGVIFLTVILPVMPGLTLLDVHLQANALLAIGASLENLEYCSFLKRSFLRVVGEQTPKLNSLRLLGFDSIDEYIPDLLQKKPYLKSLGLGCIGASIIPYLSRLLELEALELWIYSITGNQMLELLKALEEMRVLNSLGILYSGAYRDAELQFKETMPNILDIRYRLSSLERTKATSWDTIAIRKALAKNIRLAVVIKEIEECLYYLNGGKPSNEERAAFLDKLDALDKKIQLLTELDSRFIATQQVLAYMAVKALSNLLWAEPLDVNGIIRNIYTLQKSGYADFTNAILEKLYHDFSNRVKEVDFSDPLKDQYYFSMLMIATLLTDKDDKVFYSRAAVSGLVGREKIDEKGVVYGREAGFSEDEYVACLGTEEYQVKVAKPLAARLHALGIESHDSNAPTPARAGSAPRY